MQKYSEVVGLPVICADNGKRVGIVEDVIFCPQIRRVSAFLLERRGYELEKKVILLKDVLSLGKDALIINNCDCMTTLKKAESSGEFQGRGQIRGLRVYSRSGDDLGFARDILFDYRTGVIEGVEVSDGLLQDIFQGRKIIPFFGKVEFSEENILVDREAVEEMKSTGGGIRKRLLGEGRNNI